MRILKIRLTISDIKISLKENDNYYGEDRINQWTCR